MTPVNQLEYQRAQLITRDIIKAAKHTGWEELCHSISSTKSTAHAWKIINKVKNKANNSHLNDLEGILDSKELSENFMKNFAPDYAPNITELKLPYIITTKHPLENNFQIEELIHALHFKKKSTSPGMDGVNYEMIKKLPPNGLNI